MTTEFEGVIISLEPGPEIKIVETDFDDPLARVPLTEFCVALIRHHLAKNWRIGE